MPERQGIFEGLGCQKDRGARRTGIKEPGGAKNLWSVLRDENIKIG